MTRPYWADSRSFLQRFVQINWIVHHSCALTSRMREDSSWFALVALCCCKKLIFPGKLRCYKFRRAGRSAYILSTVSRIISFVEVQCFWGFRRSEGGLSCAVWSVDWYIFNMMLRRVSGRGLNRRGHSMREMKRSLRLMEDRSEWRNERRFLTSRELIEMVSGRSMMRVGGDTILVGIFIIQTKASCCPWGISESNCVVKLRIPSGNRLMDIGMSRKTRESLW